MEKGVTVASMKTTKLEHLGFYSGQSGPHTARTMMLKELSLLFEGIQNESAKQAEYRKVIVEENLLAKRSVKTRNLTASHLIELYALDPGVPIFKALRFLSARDTEAQPLLALQCSYARDALLRTSASLVLPASVGEVISAERMDVFLETTYPGRFSQATRRSTAQNLNATWTQSGHLEGKSNKRRVKAIPSPGSVTYALFLGYLTGKRGQELFATEYFSLLDCTVARGMELARSASQRGLMVFKHLGEVIEVRFPAFQPTEANE
jgi:hypothetical protein